MSFSGWSSHAAAAGSATRQSQRQESLRLNASDASLVRHAVNGQAPRHHAPKALTYSWPSSAECGNRADVLTKPSLTLLDGNKREQYG